MIHLDLYTQHCEAEFYFNDIPIRRMTASENFHSMNAHHLLLDGKNQMEILIKPGLTPSTARKLSEDHGLDEQGHAPKACLKLVKYPIGAFAGDDGQSQLLMQLNFEYDKEKNPVIQFPFSIKMEKELGPMFGGWNWEQCSQISLNESISQIHEVAKKVYQAFVQGDAETVVRLSSPALNDLGRALPAYGENAFRNDMLRDIQTNALVAKSAPAYDTEVTDYRVCADGRLVQLLNKDWTHTIKAPADADGVEYELPAFLGQYQGQWFIVL